MLDLTPINIFAFLIAYKVFGIDINRPPAYDHFDWEYIWVREQIRICAFAFWAIYCAIMESTSVRGSLGKIIMQIKVTDHRGRRLGFGRALARNLGKFISYLPCWLGFFWVAFDAKKQAWHDKLADTFVVAR